MKSIIPLFLLCTALNLTVSFAHAEDIARSPSFVTHAVAEKQLEAEQRGERWDWIQLASGEWLKGKLKSLYKNELEFDSDELGILTFDFDDINHLKTQTQHSLQIEGYSENIDGRILLSDKEITLESSLEKRTFDRNRIVAMAAASENELDYWTGKIAFGIHLRRGNSQQFDSNAQLIARRRSSKSRFRTDFVGVSSVVEEVQISDNQRLGGTYDVFVNRRLFYRPVSIEIARDPFQNIGLKWIYGASVGYYLLDNSRTEWDYTIGLGYQKTRFDSVQEDSDNTSSSGALILSTNFDTQLTSSTDLSVLYHMQLADEDAGGYSHHSIFSINHELIGNVNVGISYIWDYVDSPEIDENDIQPEQNDMRLNFNISYKFN